MLQSPAVSHPFIEVARRQDPFRVFPIESPVVRYVAQIAHLHRRSGFIHALGEVLDRLAVPKNGLDPLVLEGVGELAEHRKNIPETI
jgi:hypothetical protein